MAGRLLHKDLVKVEKHNFVLDFCSRAYLEIDSSLFANYTIWGKNKGWHKTLISLSASPSQLGFYIAIYCVMIKPCWGLKSSIIFLPVVNCPVNICFAKVSSISF